MALTAKDAYDLYSQGGKAPKPDKGAFVKCMTEVLQLPEFLVDNKHMTTATPEIKKMLDKLPDRDPFTDQDFAFIKRMKRITRMLMSLKNPNRWVNETSVSGEEPTEALKLVAKVFKSALDKCSPGWLAAMTRLAETALEARKVLTAILVEDMVAAATALAGGLGLTVAAHFGPIVDAAKCVWGVTKQVCKKALAKIFKSSPCKTVCTPLKKGGADGSFEDPCIKLLNVDPLAVDKLRPNLPTCMQGDKGSHCMMCQKVGQECKGDDDCSSGICKSTKCLAIAQLPGALCESNGQCLSTVCNKFIGKKEGACMYTDLETCDGANSKSGGCPCSDDSECHGTFGEKPCAGDACKNVCKGLYKFLGKVWSKGSCVGKPAPQPPAEGAQFIKTSDVGYSSSSSSSLSSSSSSSSSSSAAPRFRAHLNKHVTARGATADVREEQKKSAPDNSIASMDKEVESMMSSLDWNDRNKPTSLDD